MPLWLKGLFVAVATLGLGHAVVRVNQEKIDRFFMGVFRDLGRYKASCDTKRLALLEGGAVFRFLDDLSNASFNSLNSSLYSRSNLFWHLFELASPR
jgi:hypothetical protein